MTAPLVDVHAHFLTDEYVAAARAAGIEHPDGMADWPRYPADGPLLSISSPGIYGCGS
jgi:hypothetical protein